MMSKYGGTFVLFTAFNLWVNLNFKGEIVGDHRYLEILRTSMLTTPGTVFLLHRAINCPVYFDERL